MRTSCFQRDHLESGTPFEFSDVRRGKQVVFLDLLAGVKQMHAFTRLRIRAIAEEIDVVNVMEREPGGFHRGLGRFEIRPANLNVHIAGIPHGAFIDACDPVGHGIAADHGVGNFIRSESVHGLGAHRWRDRR